MADCVNGLAAWANDHVPGRALVGPTDQVSAAGPAWLTQRAVPLTARVRVQIVARTHSNSKTIAAGPAGCKLKLGGVLRYPKGPVHRFRKCRVLCTQRVLQNHPKEPRLSGCWYEAPSNASEKVLFGVST